MVLAQHNDVAIREADLAKVGKVNSKQPTAVEAETEPSLSAKQLSITAILDK